MTEPDALQQVDRTYVRWNNAVFSYFGGCDYFRLASHPKVAQALRLGLKKYGLNVAASRLTTGNHAVYAELEAALAAFFNLPSATLVSNGYAANAIAAQALQAEFSRVLFDARAHPSLLDASLQFRSPAQPFQHGDPSDLACVLAMERDEGKPVVLCDGVFGNNGEVVPLARYLEVLPASGLILLDDAHGAGVLGTNGRGTPEFAGVSREQIVQTITLSKAFGVFGGAILGTKALREKIIRKSRMFAGSTPMPLPLANAALQAVALLAGEPGFRHRLGRNVQHVQQALRERGFPIAATPAPILAVEPATPEEAGSLRERLVARKIYPSLIQYPGGPAGGYFRFAISSEHRQEQLDQLVEALTAV